jgi:hypothetical protein
VLYSTSKSDIVQFKGDNDSTYIYAHSGGLLCWTDFYTDGMIKTHKSGIIIGDQTAVDTWTS